MALQSRHLGLAAAVSAARDLAQLLQDVTTRAETPPGSRNRPIALYATNYETLIAGEDTATLTQKTPPFQWSDGSAANRLIWGQGEWS